MTSPQCSDAISKIQKLSFDGTVKSTNECSDLINECFGDAIKRGPNAVAWLSSFQADDTHYGPNSPEGQQAYSGGCALYAQTNVDPTLQQAVRDSLWFQQQFWSLPPYVNFVKCSPTDKWYIYNGETSDDLVAICSQQNTSNNNANVGATTTTTTSSSSSSTSTDSLWWLWYVLIPLLLILLVAAAIWLSVWAVQQKQK